MTADVLDGWPDTCPIGHTDRCVCAACPPGAGLELAAALERWHAAGRPVIDDRADTEHPA